LPPTALVGMATCVMCYVMRSAHVTWYTQKLWGVPVNGYCLSGFRFACVAGQHTVVQYMCIHENNRRLYKMHLHRLAADHTHTRLQITLAPLTTAACDKGSLSVAAHGTFGMSLGMPCQPHPLACAVRKSVGSCTQHPLESWRPLQSH
jgi:hypothetical protein